jgi:hypothetical protein
MSCTCHSLNLTICDMAKTCVKVASFFWNCAKDIYIYTFSGSTKRWKVLLDLVPNLTIKLLSNTRWESQIKSVQAIRYQTPHIRSALPGLHQSSDIEFSDKTDTKKIKST